MVQLSNVALAVFITSFSNLESVHKIENFVLQFLLPLGCFLDRDFKLLHVFTNSFKLSLNILKFSFGQFCSFSCSFALILLYSKLSGDFIKFLFVVLFSKNLTFFKIASASLDIIANLVTASAKAVSAFFASSSINITRLLSAPTSSSAFLNSFSFSSYV